MISLLEVHRWWDTLLEEKKTEIFFDNNPDSINDDWFAWWHYLTDVEKIEIYKENKEDE